MKPTSKRALSAAAAYRAGNPVPATRIVARHTAFRTVGAIVEAMAVGYSPTLLSDARVCADLVDLLAARYGLPTRAWRGTVLA